MLSKYIPEFQRSLEAVLRVDPTLRPVVESNTFHTFLAPRPEMQSSFQYLVRNVLSQQVSGAAGQAIMARFLALCNRNAEPEKFPTPETLLEFSVEELRGAGLSVRKAEYVRGLAEAYIRKELSDELFHSVDDDEVVDRIVAIRGLGPWTAQMFLIFYLFRPDTFSVGDVGVQRGLRRYLKERPHILKEIESQDHSATSASPASPGKSKKAQNKGPIPADLKHMEKVAARFAPHRTAFQLILWKLSDIQMDTIEARDAVAAKAAAEERNGSTSEPTQAAPKAAKKPPRQTAKGKRATAKKVDLDVPKLELEMPDPDVPNPDVPNPDVPKLDPEVPKLDQDIPTLEPDVPGSDGPKLDPEPLDKPAIVPAADAPVLEASVDAVLDTAKAPAAVRATPRKRRKRA